MNVNEEKRAKFIDCAGKRVNNVLHDMQILEPMARSSVYDFTKQDIEEMFAAMQETLDNVKAEFYKKFEDKVRSEKKIFSFGAKVAAPVAEVISEEPAEILTTETVTMSENVETITDNEAEELPSIAEDLATVASTNEDIIF